MVKFCDSSEIRRRVRRQDHFYRTDKALLFAYPDLSDGAKITYQVLDCYDWASTDLDGQITSKGFAYPLQSTLAQIRGVDVRTIRRHLKELTDAGLITIETTPTNEGRRNIYWIEECSQERFENYLEMLMPHSPSQPDGGADKNVLMGADKNVRYNQKNAKAEKGNQNQSPDLNSVSGVSEVLEVIKPLVTFPMSPQDYRDLEAIVNDPAFTLERCRTAVSRGLRRHDSKPITNPFGWLRSTINSIAKEKSPSTNITEDRYEAMYPSIDQKVVESFRRLIGE